MKVYSLKPVHGIFIDIKYQEDLHLACVVAFIFTFLGIFVVIG